MNIGEDDGPTATTYWHVLRETLLQVLEGYCAKRLIVRDLREISSEGELCLHVGQLEVCVVEDGLEVRECEVLGGKGWGG